MKKTFKSILMSAVVLLTVVNAQKAKAQNTFPASGSAGIGTAAPDGSALLEVKSTSKGILTPRMTKSQRDGIGSPATGLLIYQTNSTPGFYYYTGTAWSPLKVNSVRGLSDNLFIGQNAGDANTTGTGNIALGKAALNGNINRIENIAIGDSSQFALGVGAFGNQAWYNTAVGSKSQRFSTTGTKNTSIGAYSLYNDVAGNDNVAVGYEAMYANTFNHFNVAVGETALRNVKADNNTAVGYSAGSVIIGSTECTFLGNDADQTGTTAFTNATAVGSASRTTGNAMVRVGNSSVGSIGGFVNFTNISDGRFKKEIKENVPGLDFINKLKPVTYHLDVKGLRTFLHEENSNESAEAKTRIAKGIADKEQVLYSGFVAQEVERAAQETGYDFSGVDKPQNAESLYGLRYAEFTVPLVKAVQEVDLKNQVQDGKIAMLEKENQELKLALLQLQTSVAELQKNQKQIGGSMSGSMTPRLSIAPNPTSDVATITISSNDNMQNLVVKIMDASGKIIRTYNATSVSSSFEFNTASLSKGTYMVQLFNQNELMKTEKLIVQ